MPKKLTTPDFIEKAKAIHGDYYDYSAVEYVNYKTPVTIGCPVHGPWRQKPMFHLMHAHGCRSCTWRSRYAETPPGHCLTAKEKRAATNMARYGGHPMSNAAHDQSAMNKRKATFESRFGGWPMSDPFIAAKVSATWQAKSPDQIDAIMKKKAATFLGKYGYDNPFNDTSTKNAIHELRRERGDWTPSDLLDELSLYKRRVWLQTELSWRHHDKEINPEEHHRGLDYHLDHMLSIADGFQQHIPPEVIGHRANLRVIDSFSNISKGRRSLLTYEQLLIRILNAY